MGASVPDTRTRRRSRPIRGRLQVERIPVLAGAFTMLVGAVVFVGWIVGLDGVKRLFPGLPQMKANSALVLIALGCAAVMLREGRCHRCWRVGHGLALVVAVFGAVVLGEYLFGSVGIDQLLFHDPGPTPGRPAPHTAGAFLLIGLALTTLDRDQPRYRPSGWLLPAGGLVVLSALVGYLYEVDFLRATVGTTGIALPTALALAALVVGALCLRPERGLVGYLRRDDPGAATARRMLPAAIVIPLGLGLLGRAADGLGFDARASGGLIALATICMFAALMLATARRLSNTDDQRRAAERAAGRLATIVGSSEGAIVSVDLDGNIETWNEAATRLFGYTAEEVVGSSSMRLVAPERRAEAAELFARALCGSAIEYRETVALTKDGRQIDVGMSGFPIRSSVTVIGAATIVHDITEQTRAARELAQARSDIDHFFGLSLDLMAIANDNGHFVRVNPAFERTLGYSSQELIERPSIDFVHPDDRQRTLDNYAAQAGGRASPKFENRYRCKNGKYRWLRWSATATMASGLIYATARDVTEQKRIERRLRQLADHDSLTGLRNRRVFEEALMLQVARCQRYGERATLLLVDLDGFKQINDTHGHRTGDNVLKAVAAAIKHRVRATDVAARIGGDEFAVLLPHTSTSNASIIALGIKQVIVETIIDADPTDLHPSASIGIANLDEDTAGAETALVAADRAMYEDKQTRRRKQNADAIAPNPLRLIETTISA
jgi:diguanylate cyclase (GGDEF)-like protein/PAS domain S-box-containing protein